MVISTFTWLQRTGNTSLQSRYEELAAPPHAGSLFTRYSGLFPTARLLAIGLVGCILLLGAGCSNTRSGGLRVDSDSGSSPSQVRSSPGEVTRLVDNAHYYQLMGRPEAGLKELEEANRLYPDDLQILNALTQGYEEMGAYEQAQKIYQDALKRAPHRSLANNLCFSYYLQGQWDQSEACFRQVLARDPQNTAARNNLGLLLCRLERLEEARHLWQEAEGEAAAEDKMNQALAALGMETKPVYAQRPKSPPPLKEKQPLAPAPEQPQPNLPAPQLQETDQKAMPVKADTPLPAVKEKEASRVAPEKIAAQLPPTNLKPVPPNPPNQVRDSQKPLTAKERWATAIEVRNGTPTGNLARKTWTMLDIEGFTVVGIGNHSNFRAEKTIIYYRSKAERVAENLRAKFFPMAVLKNSEELHNVDIKLLLGHNLIEDQKLMARLTGQSEEE